MGTRQHSSDNGTFRVKGTKGNPMHAGSMISLRGSRSKARNRLRKSQKSKRKAILLKPEMFVP